MRFYHSPPRTSMPPGALKPQTAEALIDVLLALPRSPTASDLEHARRRLAKRVEPREFAHADHVLSAGVKS